MSRNLDHEVSALLAENIPTLKTALDTLPLGVMITDREGRVIYYNQAQAAIDDLEPGLILGKVENDVLFGPDIMAICHRTGRPILGFIYPYQTIRGKEVNGAYWAYPLRRGGRVEAAICFTQPLATAEEEYKVQVQWPAATPVPGREKKVVGSGPAFKKALGLARQAAKGPSPVLLVGATGTGKELFARYIHQNSSRKHKPFMAVNCAAIPGALLEGLLFGTAKGSFTGAVDRAGLFEEANGGVLYLDEMDSMPLELQPKLLRVLQETTVRRLGSGEERHLDLKIISSIGINPQTAMADNRLRDDLYYRLSVLTINIPPLVERLEDLEELATYFMSKYNILLNKQVMRLDDGLLTLLRGYAWPGNVRELEHFLAGAINLVSDRESTLTRDHIPDHYRFILRRPSAHEPFRPGFGQPVPARPPAPPRPAWSVYGTAEADGRVEDLGRLPYRGPEPPPALSRWHKEYDQIMAALTAAGGHVTRAAIQLGISRQLLHYKMKKYGLDRRDFK